MTHDTNIPVLIVDDNPSNLSVLSAHLKDSAYKVLFAKNGFRALEIAKEAQPEIILLDIMMPGIDGFETCRKLKQDHDTARIPVLFLSALDDTDSKVKGFEAGGLDYVSKPFEHQELHARLETHIALYRARRENEKYAAEMEHLAQQRAKELVHAERLATLGTLSAGIAHEINNPLTYTLSGAHLVSQLWEDIAQYLEQQTIEDTKVTYATEKIPKMLANIIDGTKRIHNIASSLKAYAKKEGDEKSACRLADCVDEALRLCHNRLKYHVTVHTDIPKDLPAIEANRHRFEQVLVNLFINAADAIESRGNGTLFVSAAADENAVRIDIEDTGPGFDENTLDSIWDAFYTTKPKEIGTGLGLSITRGIIEDHHGTITAENREQGGARFVITLPQKEAAA